VTAAIFAAELGLAVAGIAPSATPNPKSVIFQRFSAAASYFSNHEGRFFRLRWYHYAGHRIAHLRDKNISYRQYVTGLTDDYASIRLMDEVFV